MALDSAARWRYCPSIEDKIVRFGERDGHQIFLEPEGLDDTTVYPNGISTSLPEEVQLALLASIPGVQLVSFDQPEQCCGFGGAFSATEPTLSVGIGLEKLKTGTNPKKALLLITDGEDNRSRYTFQNVKDFVKEQDVQIYAIGITDDWNSQLGAGHTGRAMIEELSDLTGGRAFFPDSVYELEDICTKIAVELKNQYVVGYHSTNAAKDGKWRKLRMKVNPPKGIQHLNVRSKAGYYAPMADAAAAAANKN